MHHLKRTPNYLIYHHVVDTFKKTTSTTSNLALFSTAVNKESRKSSLNEIVIPKAIKRGPTDILEALASTVKPDYTGPHYKYLDDPYLTPIGNNSKRAFSLAKEAGRKAAHYFFDKYPQYFYRDISEPKIEAFTYKEVYDDSMEFDEFDLQKCIIRSDISNAIVCYNKLAKENKPISEETLLDLLDLVSFYNCNNVPERYVEEEWFKKNPDNRIESNFWKDNGFAEQLFGSLENKSSRAYSSLIQGMCKYFQTERAFAFYKQALDLGMKLNVQTYNSLVSSSYDLHSTNEERWKTVLDILRTMQSNEIKPDLGTLNAVLREISKYKFWNLNADLAKKVFNEFAFKFGIEPSLATYYHLLRIFYKSRNSRSSLLYEILDKMNSKTFELQSVNDVNFFSTAMDVCLNMNDLPLGYKVHELAEKNQKFLGRGVNQNAYYDRFFKLLCSAESIENFMIIYTKYVPHTYTPTIGLMEQIMKTIKIYKSLDYVPQIWNDIVLCGYTNRIEVLQDLLMTMDEIKPGDSLLPTFNKLVLDIIGRVETRIERNAENGISNLDFQFSKENFQWTAKALSYCLSILVKAQNMESAFEVLQKLDQLKDVLLDQPESQSLIDFCKNSITDNNFDYALYCIKYCKEMDRFDVLTAIAKEFENVDIGNAKMRNELDKIL